MTTKTDYRCIVALEELYKPAHRGFVNAEEETIIKRELELETRSDIELQNIRDFCVMFYSRELDDVAAGIERMDKMSAITCVIDGIKFNRGLEI